jgi:hypothetical protein
MIPMILVMVGLMLLLICTAYQKYPMKRKVMGYPMIPGALFDITRCG